MKKIPDVQEKKRTIARTLISASMAAMFLVSLHCAKDSTTAPSQNNTPPSSGTIEVVHNGSSGYTFGFHGTDQVKRYQTFIAGSANLNITGVDVKIRKNDSTAAYRNITVELYDVLGHQPANLLAVSSIDIDSLGSHFSILSAPLTYYGLTAGQKYAIVLGQSNVQSTTNPGFEWCTKITDSTCFFGKFSGTAWTEESILGDGWMRVHVNNTAGINAYSFTAGSQVVLFDDFQRAAGRVGNGWFYRNSPGYSESPDIFGIYDDGGGNKAVRLTTNWPNSNGDSLWTDYTVSAKIKVGHAYTYASLDFRANLLDDCYRVYLNGSTFGLHKYTANSNSELASVPVSCDSSVFYNVKVNVYGNRIRAYFNNASSPTIEYTDSSALSHGFITVFAYPYQNHPGMFDDVLVTVP